MKSKQLSVEVFRDYETPGVPIESAESAIGLLVRYTDTIALGSMSRMIKMGTRQNVPEISSINFPYSSMTADMNLILTGRMFDNRKPGVTRGGIAQRHVTGNIVKRVAIISVPSNEYPDIAGAHELGHLLNLKTTGKFHDGSGHCMSADCMMHAVHREKDDSLALDVNPFSKFTNRFRKDRELKHESRPHEDMCQECAQQLGENAFWLLRAKNGLALPPGYEL